jgi:Skp family chaperone for outer membrane proteins
MMKKIALACAMMMVLTAGAMAAGGKTAYVDTQAVFDKTSVGKKYQGVVREYVESRKKILDADYEEIQKLQEDYNKQKQAKLLNEQAQRAKEETLQSKINAFQKKRDEFGAEIQKKNEELSKEFNQQMMEVLRVIVKKEKISLVLSKNINILSKAEIPSVIYADDDMNLTEKVIEEMDKKAETK